MLKWLLRALGFSADTEKPASPTPPVESPPQPVDSLATLFLSVVCESEDRARFQQAAQKVGRELPFAEAQKLTKFFHDPPPEPEDLKETIRKYGMLTAWLHFSQDAVYEVLFQYKEEAIPLLYEVGFGVYDWTQYKAIGTLCRLAREGIQTDKIIADIGANIGDFRYEAVFPSLEALATIPDHEKIPEIMLGIFDEYIEDDPIDGLNILLMLVRAYPNKVKSRLDFLRGLARGKGLEGRSPLLDGAVLSIDQEGKESFSMGGPPLEGTFEESHRINATALFYFVDQTDPEINALMDHWEQHAEEEGFRNMVANLKKDKGGE